MGGACSRCCGDCALRDDADELAVAPTPRRPPQGHGQKEAPAPWRCIEEGVQEDAVPEMTQPMSLELAATHTRVEDAVPERTQPMSLELATAHTRVEEKPEPPAPQPAAATAGTGEGPDEQEEGEAAGREEGDWNEEVLLELALEAAARGQFRSALETWESVCQPAVPSSSPLSADPVFAELPGRVRRIDTVLRSCTPPSGSDWKRFDMEVCTLWRTWDAATGALKVIMRWVAAGSLLQQVAALREVDVLEKFWDGACWDMESQHATSTSLVRWLQKDPFSGKKTEVILERVFCDCLDGQMPCWVLLERSPAVEAFQDFAGKWGAFNIGAAPHGFLRAVTADSGRVLEPLAADKVQVTMALEVVLPAVIRWVVTDAVLALAVRLGSKSTMQSWEKVIASWERCGFDERIKQDPDFYEPVSDRLEKFLASRPASGGGTRAVT